MHLICKKKTSQMKCICKTLQMHFIYQINVVKSNTFVRQYKCFTFS